ncbi:hypothetical protein C2845_PM13G00010 [Panicum miliaceum]|uniref:DUF6598 domain-containing protein n=1 Tax=Panicum miliaceum TaxID=4540 RepID=A0A3L6RHY1_PANMI|nr:hypothetical protein C2845_PM13G00010 [Panicum miliaceum]
MATLNRVEGDSGKPYRRQPISSANVIIPPLDNIETSNKDALWNTLEDISIKHDTWGQIVKPTVSEEDASSTKEDHKGNIVVSDKEESSDDVYMLNLLTECKHRDGSIFRGMDTLWKKEYRIVDRSEKLAKIPMDGGLVELYGYIAVRDELEPLLNYVVNFSRDEPIIVKQGSHINMAGPKRGIDMMDYALIEYDMRIKSGEQEKDDLQLIDGASIIGPVGIENRPSRVRIAGDCGAIDLTLSRLGTAVEATVEILISEVQISFNLSLGCLTSGLNKEIRLFDGAIAESCCLNRYVVAVVLDSLIDLKFKLGSLLSSSDQHCCYFNSKLHGHDTQEIKTDFALISLKIRAQKFVLKTAILKAEII